MYDKVKKALELTPLFRERRYRGHYILIMAMREVGAIPLDKLVKTGDEVTIKVGSLNNPEPFENIVSSCESITRTWRKVLKEHESLRGNDYNDKEALEDEKLEELGYKALSSSQADKELEKI